MVNSSNIIFELIAGDTTKIGLITLNRPHALNALNSAMTAELHQQLKQWELDSAISAVVLRSNDTRAFCAGGDIREVYEHKLKSSQIFTDFFWHEFRLNYYIANYSKPYIALLDGITMGGGAGISIHGRYRIATERALFAMPETSIGFFPDVGASYFLSRCPGQIGTYLALTSARIQAADTHYLGLTNYYISHAQLPNLITALTNNPNPLAIASLFNTLKSEPAPSALANYRELIDECFCFNTIEEILTALQTHPNKWCLEIAKTLLNKSPTSLKITLEQLRRGAKLNLADCLKMEYRIAQHMLQSHDFYEGVRATIIDKDRQPNWQPAKLAEVEEQDIAEYFSALTQAKELDFN